MAEPPGRNARSIIRIESKNSEQEDTVGEEGGVREKDDKNSAGSSPPKSLTASALREDKKDSAKLSPKSSKVHSNKILPNSKLDARSPGRNTGAGPDYKDQVRSRSTNNAPVKLGNKEAGTPEYKDQVRGPTRHNLNNNNNNRTNQNQDDDSSSLIANNTGVLEISAVHAEVVDSEGEAARLRQQILRELEGQAPVAAEVVTHRPSTLVSQRHRGNRTRSLLLVVVVAVVTAVVVAITVTVVNNTNNNDGSSDRANTAVSETVAPITLSPSLSPTISFWTELGDAVRGPETGNRLGDSVALSADGRILATGGQGTTIQDGADGIGRIRIFELADNNETWLQLGQDITGSYGRNLGRSVALSSNGRIVAGGEYFGGDRVQGRVVVHRFNTSSQEWELLGQELFGDGIDGNQPWFGFSISLSDDGLTLAVGAPIDNGIGLNAGRLRVFTYNAASEAWLQMGSDFVPTQDVGQLGISVALSGDGLRLVAGAYFTRPELTYEAGRVTVYQFVNGDWEQIGQHLDGENEDDFLGWSVAMTPDGTRLACSDILFDSSDFGESVGRVRVLELIGSVWELVGQPLVGNNGGDEFGSSIALSSDGTTLVVGAIDLGGGSRPGYVRVFRFDGRNWIQRGTDLYGDNPGDRFGTWVATSADGTIIAGGGPFNDFNGMDSGVVHVYKTELL